MQTAYLGFGFVLLCLFLVPSPSHAAGARDLSDKEIRQIIIEQSIASYSGQCACPYSAMKSGKACGGRSAYSKAGGASLFCYPRNVPQAMVEAYRKRLGGNS